MMSREIETGGGQKREGGEKGPAQGSNVQHRVGIESMP